ncbi:MAG: aminotransferase class V-fold PLP-dependent enzyme [Lactobacillus sp.]|jgi:cysteine desulfurase|nr:aminotransferase class V-fold PLP-dependent enzyme [Lactobacillus sp.]MCI2033646.1 aminotransferase class V-fold PLP-dependent enzyme [Lactobacillus sp.]
MIYFDHAATTQMSAAAIEAYTTVAQHFYANGESLHRAGNEAGQLVNEARLSIARRLGIAAEGLIFTSGGTESNQLGIAALAQGSAKRELLVSPLEHSSVGEVLDALARQDGYRIKTLAVDATGHVTPAMLAAALTPDTALVVVQAVNAITGICQDLAGLNQVAQAQGVPLFVDAVQGVAKIDLPLATVAGFSASAHKFNGPKSCGFLYLSSQVLAKPRFHHVFQQNGYLPGTMDIPGIVSAETAFTAAFATQAATFAHLQTLKQRVLTTLAPSIQPVADWAEYPGIIGMLLPHTQGQEAATAMGQRGLSFSTVSACSIRDPRPDNTLMALGLSADDAAQYIRWSLGAENTVAEVDQAVAMLNAAYA